MDRQAMINLIKSYRQLAKFMSALDDIGIDTQESPITDAMTCMGAAINALAGADDSAAEDVNLRMLLETPIAADEAEAVGIWERIYMRSQAVAMKLTVGGSRVRRNEWVWWKG